MNRSRSADHPILKRSLQTKMHLFWFSSTAFQRSERPGCGRTAHGSGTTATHAIRSAHGDTRQAENDCRSDGPNGPLKLSRWIKIQRPTLLGHYARSERHPDVPPTQGRYNRTPVEPRSQRRFIRFSTENSDLHFLSIQTCKTHLQRI